MPVHNIGTALTEVTTEQKAPLGQIYERWHPTYGEQQWIYIQMTGGAAVAGNVIARAASTATPGTGIAAPTSAPRMRLLGVAQHAIAQNSYGWIQRKGAGALVRAGASTNGIAANASIQVDGTDSGAADDDAASAALVFGFSHAAIAAGATGRCTIDCTG